MAGYADTKKLIEDSLVGRPEGTLIYPKEHQAFALQMLDYIRSVELMGASTLQGIATPATVPVQPNNGRVSYIATVPAGTTYTFTNFHQQNGNSISITSGPNTVSLVTLLWNGEYWTAQNNQVQLMLNIVDGYLYAGIALPETTPNPVTPDELCYYIAATAGTYGNFGGIVVNEAEVAFLKWNGTGWTKEVTGLASSEEVSRLGQEVGGNNILLGSHIVDLSNYEKTEGSLSGGIPVAWNLDGYNRYHKAIPIPSGVKVITIEANDNINATFVITKTYSVPSVSGESVDGATGQRSATNISAGQSKKISVPADGTYLVINVNSNSVDMTPKIVQFSSGIIDEKIDKELGLHKLSKSVFDIVGYIDNGGTYQPAGATYRCTNYLSLYPSGIVKYNCTFGGGVFAIAVYDSSLNLISTDSIVGNNGDSVLEYKNESGQMRYIRLCVYYADIDSCHAYIDNTGVFEHESQTDEQIVAIKEQLSYGWRYGNINTDGSIITPIAKNRIHSTLISIINLQKITTDNTHYIGYALYDEEKSFITRWWTDNVSELDFALIGLSNPRAKYVSVLMMNTDNSNFNLETASPDIYLYYGDIAELTYSQKPIKMNPQIALPVIIFNFDDCLLPGDYNVVKLFESRGARCGFAFIATETDIANKSKIYLDFQKRGFDIMNHSGGVQSIVTSNYTFEQAKDLIVKDGLERLQKAGFVINGFVCPNSEMSDDFLPIVAKTHAYNMIGTPYGANGRDADVNKLVRYSLENNTKTDIKSYIDECIANDKCLIFYAHTSRFGQTIAGELFDINKVAEILDYCIAKRDNLECWVCGTDEGIKYYFDI